MSHAARRRARAGWRFGVLALLLLRAVPAASDEAPRPKHLLYLHGAIVQQQQDARPRHPQHGFYELEQILAAFRERGFAVSGEIRPRAESVRDSAEKVAAQVRTLLAEGARASDVTLLGASLGAQIALRAAARLQEPELRVALLGACLTQALGALRGEGEAEPAGRVLTVREASDDVTEGCSPWSGERDVPGRLVAREIVLHTGSGHGFLYRPLPEWVDPVVEWARLAPAKAVE